MRFILVLCLFTGLASCDKVKQLKKTEIVYKILDPLREGKRNNKLSYAKISIYNVTSTGKLMAENYSPYEEYDTLGNIINENKSAFHHNYKFKYDTNGFLITQYYDGCYTSKEAVFYQKTNPFELTLKGYYLKDNKWDSPIDTNFSATKYTGGILRFYPNGYLKNTRYKSRVNTTYFYDSLDRLATVIDSFDRNGEDYNLPVRKEYIYNSEGKLTQIYELNRSNLLSKANVNKKGLIDTIFYFDKARNINKLEVYQYK